MSRNEVILGYIVHAVSARNLGHCNIYITRHFIIDHDVSLRRACALWFRDSPSCFPVHKICQEIRVIGSYRDHPNFAKTIYIQIVMHF